MAELVGDLLLLARRLEDDVPDFPVRVDEMTPREAAIALVASSAVANLRRLVRAVAAFVEKTAGGELPRISDEMARHVRSLAQANKTPMPTLGETAWLWCGRIYRFVDKDFVDRNERHFLPDFAFDLLAYEGGPDDGRRHRLGLRDQGSGDRRPDERPRETTRENVMRQKRDRFAATSVCDDKGAELGWFVIDLEADADAPERLIRCDSATEAEIAAADKNAEADGPPWAVFDGQDSLWLGDQSAVRVFDSFFVAQAAARVADVRLGWAAGRCRAKHYEGDAVSKRDELETRMTTEGVLRLLEEGEVL
jgi:hypothetical protein